MPRRTPAKHLRQQHNIATPAPTRGGYRKRKRSMTPPGVPPPPLPLVLPAPAPVVAPAPPPAPTLALAPAPARQASSSPTQHPPDVYAPSHYNFANRAYAQYHDPRDSGFNTFRVNPAINDRPAHRPAPAASSTSKLRSEGLVDRQPLEGYLPPDQREEEVASSSSGEEDSGKPYNAEAMGGRSKAMVKYLIMKAKYRYVLDEKGLLSDELDVLKRQEKEEWRQKEASVDHVLRGFGPRSQELIHEPDAPTNGKRSRAPVPVSPREDARGADAHAPSHHPRPERGMAPEPR
ncbi:hypothetical protein JB92DRAFT_256208 [Gautieria morchelliformis]|nr:hypothetical protein JB92DRAFT_256208 [Gautieria morchelliformis]